MVVSRDDNLITTQDAAPKNACGRGTGNKYIISHGLKDFHGTDGLMSPLKDAKRTLYSICDVRLSAAERQINLCCKSGAGKQDLLANSPALPLDHHQPLKV